MLSFQKILNAARVGVSLTAMLHVVACGGPPEAQLEQPTPTLTQHLNHTPPLVTLSAQKSRVAADHELDLRIALALRDEDSLDELIVAQHDADSPQYQQYLTPEEFQKRFHPKAEHVARVQAALEEQGIHTQLEAHGTVLRARAKVKDAEQFFDTELYHFTSPEGYAFHAPNRPIALPADLGIQAVRGLATPPRPHSNYVLRGDSKHAVAAPTYDAATIRSAYNIPTAAQGKGARLALIELDGYVQKDIVAYAQNNHIRAVPLTNILVDGFDGTVQDSGAQVEVTMDIQLMNALAPQADEIRIYEASNAGSGFFDIFNELANPKLADAYLSKIISCSWGVAEDQSSSADVKAEAAIFKQMAAQGQTVFSASGDSGARDDGQNLGVDNPAAQPYVVGVGGTTLLSHNGQYVREKAWLNGGGGISQFWGIPAWQRGAINSLSRGSTTRRNVPDVSLNADPETGYEIFVAGQSQVVGGTSCAAPLWAAFLGLVEEARTAKQLAPLGFLSPRLYALGKNANSSSTFFHDIADKSTNGFYPAVSGYDNATGLGTFNGAPLIDVLSQK